MKFSIHKREYAMNMNLRIVCLISFVFGSFAAYPGHKDLIIEWEQYLTRPGSDYDSAKLESFVSRGYVYQTAVAAAINIRLYEWTSSTAYADRSVEFMQAIVDYTSGISDSFFLPFPFTDAYIRMKAAGVLTTQLDSSLTSFANSNFTAVTITPHADDIHNQHFARAAGLAFAAQTWPNASRAGQWNQYAADFFNKVVANGDITENAMNYEYICSFYLWHLADKLGRANELDNEIFKKVFDRYCDYVAPSGKIADYGDSGGFTGDVDWPMLSTTDGFIVPAFYRAAEVYNEPKFQWAGRKIYEMIYDKEPFTQQGYTALVPLYAMTYIEDWNSSDIQPAIADFSSKITSRKYRTYLGSPVSYYSDKLLLGNSKQDGSPFVMSDLFTPHGSHTHINQQASINYFEYDGVPLLTTNGYHAWGPEGSNLCIIRPSADDFPHQQPLYQSMRWYTAEVPLSNIRSYGREGQIQFDQINFRITNASGGAIAFRFDNMRLSSSAGELMIDDFETTTGWNFGGSGSAITYDKTEGDKCVQIAFNSDGTYFNRKGYGLTTVDLDQYTHIKLDWKASSAITTVRPFIFRIESTDQTLMSDFHVDFLQMSTERDYSFAAQNESFSYGTIRCDQYFTPDTKFARRMLMTNDGVLIVRDDMLPQEGAAGRDAGPLWNLSSSAQPYSGGNWVCSNGGSKELFVYMDSANTPDEIGYQTVNIRGRENHRAAFVKRILQSDTAERFISVLVPRNPSDDLNTLASSVSVDTGLAGFEGRTDITLTLPGKQQSTYTIDVLYEDNETSTVVYGEAGGLMAINSYDKSPKLRKVGDFEFNAESAQVGYDSSSEEAVVKSVTVKGAKYLSYEGSVLVQSDIAADIDISYLSDGLTGVVDAPDGAVIKIHSPGSNIQLLDLQQNPISGFYDSKTETYNITIGSIADCDAIIAAGYGLPADISGSQGKPDCVVDMFDFAKLAQYWLNSTIN